jgi:AbrB family looped-hinge helix DNA binding protein
MGDVVVTRMSSKGQIVVPKLLRDALGLGEGEMFVLFGEEDAIILKKIDMPSKKKFDEILAWGERYARKKKITRKALMKAISDARAEAR